MAIIDGGITYNCSDRQYCKIVTKNYQDTDLNFKKILFLEKIENYDNLKVESLNRMYYSNQVLFISHFEAKTDDIKLLKTSFAYFVKQYHRNQGRQVFIIKRSSFKNMSNILTDQFVKECHFGTLNKNVYINDWYCISLDNEEVVISLFNLITTHRTTSQEYKRRGH